MCRQPGSFSQTGCHTSEHMVYPCSHSTPGPSPTSMTDIPSQFNVISPSPGRLPESFAKLAVLPYERVARDVVGRYGRV